MNGSEMLMRKTTNGHEWTRMGESCSENPNGIPAQSPGLLGTSYPGKPKRNTLQPQRGCDRWRRHGRNPVGVVAIPRHAPRVARSSQPWAGGHNPFGIEKHVVDS